MDIQDLLKSANKTLDEVKRRDNPVFQQDPGAEQLILEKLAELNQQLVKALEREIKVDNTIEVATPKVSVEPAKVEVTNQVPVPNVQVNPELVQKKTKVRYKIEYDGRNQLTAIVAEPME
jgi:hypothetical protein